jgi:hypothetical protein
MCFCVAEGNKKRTKCVTFIRSMNRLLFLILSFVVGLFGSGSLFAQFYQGSNLEFGKNRVQYKEYDWFYLPSEHFEVYFYVGGENLAKYTLLASETNLQELESFFDYSLDEKIQILSYLNHGEFRQSNIGIRNDDQFNIGGTARIMGNKMFVYYETDHGRLEGQIRENISRVIFSQMMYGGDWKDVLKSNTLLSMPRWFEEGIISYAAQGWNADKEAAIRDMVSSPKFKSLNRVYGDDAVLAGQAFWNYISEVYGPSVIPNILYMARISRNVESGFLFVLGLSMESVTHDFIDYYKQKNIRNEKIPGFEPTPESNDKQSVAAWKKRSRQLGELPVKHKSKYVYSQFSESPDGKYVSWVTNEMGQYKIWLHEWATGKTKRIFKKEFRLERITDYTFPVLAWHPSSRLISFAFESKSETFLGSYNVEEKEKTIKQIFLLEKIIDMSYSDDGQKMIFSGVNRGQTDLYLYQVIGNNHEQLTNDIYDDLNPKFIRESEAIIFSSNRPDDTLRKEVPIGIYPKNHDIFVFNLENRFAPLEQITTTPDVHEYQASGYSARHYTFLASAKGHSDRYLCSIDSSISRIDTTIHYRFFTVTDRLSSFGRSPLDYDVQEKQGKYTLVFERDGKYLFSKHKLALDKTMDNGYPKGDDASNSVDGDAPLDERIYFVTDSLGEKEVDINNYVFEDERKNYQYEKESIRLEEVIVDTTSIAQDTTKKPFEFPRSKTYRLNFATDYILTQVDNSFTNSFYQNYSGPTSITPGLSGLIKIGVSDLFEDYKIVGGFRLSGTLSNNDYGLSFENLSGRKDKRLMFQRQSQMMEFGSYRFRFFTHSFQYQVRYPFNELASLRISAIARNDRFVALSVDPPSLASPNYNEYNVGLKLEYVYDNTITRGLNLYNGTRYKFWFERYQQPDRYDEKTDLNVFGFDFRHYERIHRELIAAFRLAGSSSFGAYKLVHFLGGVDNWLNQKIDNSMPIATDQNYSFQSFSAPVRGFYVNSRNGNTFAVANSEVRWPVFKYLLKKPIKSDFVENFQLISFFDMGASWTGKDPYSPENTFNTNTITINPVTVTVDNNREPLIYGYGFGLRSRILGYFVRADWAWGVDDGRLLDRVFYLSLNLDF